MPTELPNLHPVFVHFPVALLVLGLALDLCTAFSRRRRHLRAAVTFLYGLGTLSAAATWITGRMATDMVGPVGLATEHLISNHRALATRTTLIFAVATAGRLSLHALNAHVDAASARTLRALLLLTALFGGWILIQTAHRGGSLVYDHAVGVAVLDHDTAGRNLYEQQPTTGGTLVQQMPANPLRRQADGTIMWTPTGSFSVDIDSVFDIVTLAAQSDIHGVADSSQSPGVLIRSSGSVVLLIPETIGDLIAELAFEVIDFSGSISIVHHFVEATRYESFQVSTGGTAALRVHEHDRVTTLDSSHAQLSAEAIRISVMAAGSHLKGFLGDQTITHGHRQPTASNGQFGVLLDGEGSIRLLSLRVAPSTPGH